MTALTEVEAAAAAGFKRWAHFSRARKARLFPPPARVLPGIGPLWTQAQIDAWLGLTPETGALEEEAIRRAEEAGKARAPGNQAKRRRL